MEKTETKDVMITTQNALVNLNLKLSKAEYDIFFFILYLFKDNQREYEFASHDLYNFAQKSKFCTSAIRDVCMKFGSSFVSIYENEEKWSIHYLLQSISYDKGKISVKLTDSALELFKSVRSNFTQFQLYSALSLNGQYSKRLYWMLCQWKKQGYICYNIEKFKDFLGINVVQKGRKVSSYKDNGVLRSLVQKCVREINDISDITVEDTWTRSGHSIVSVSFDITVKKDAETITFKEDVETVSFIKQMMAYNFSESDARQMLNNGITKESFKKIIDRVNVQIHKGTVDLDNIDAYLRECFITAGFIKKPVIRIEKEDGRHKKKSVYDAERKSSLEIIRTALKAGAPVSVFRDKIEEYNITDDELAGD